MDLIEYNIQKVEQNIKMLLDQQFENIINQTKSSPVHNHLPISGLVDGCEYCALYGNIFEDGPVKLDDLPEIKNHLYCLNNNLKKK